MFQTKGWFLNPTNADNLSNNGAFTYSHICVLAEVTPMNQYSYNVTVFALVKMLRNTCSNKWDSQILISSGPMNWERVYTFYDNYNPPLKYKYQ